MAFTKQKILTSAKLIFAQDGTQFVEVEWANQVLEDSVLLTSVPHRGAYPVDTVTGNPDSAIQTIMGIKLSKLFSNAGDAALAQLVVAQQSITSLQTLKDQLDAKLVEVKGTLHAAKLEKRALRQRLIDNDINAADIFDIPVSDDI